MSQQEWQTGDPALHDFEFPEIYQPLHNSIPPELINRYDPVYVEYYNKYNAGRLHTHEVPIEDFRKNPARYLIAYGRARGPDVYRITEQKCPVKGGEITIRIFEPAPKQETQGEQKKKAAYINFHGGGWVFGNLGTDHDFCKTLVDGLDGNLIAFDVDYRLAPENPYPIPVEDCWAAFNWVRRHPPVLQWIRVFRTNSYLDSDPKGTRVQSRSSPTICRRRICRWPSCSCHRSSLSQRGNPSWVTSLDCPRV